MKKKIIALLLVLLIVISLAACSPNSATTSATTAAATTAAAKEVVELKAAIVLADDHPTTKSLKWFSDEVFKRTDGEVKITVFSNSQLGGQSDAIEGLQLGTLDLSTVSAGPLSQFVPELNVLSLPYIFSGGTEHMFRALEGEAGSELIKNIEENQLVFLGWADSGSRNIINDTKPVNTPEDLKGMKIRVMNSQAMVDAVNLMGAIATPMEQGEVYSALEQGVLDGWENNPVTLYTLKLYEVSDYFSWTQHFMVPDVLLMSPKAFEKLNEEQQKIVREVGFEAAQLQKEYFQQNINDTVEKLKEVGVKFNTIDDLSPFADRVAPVYEGYVSKFGDDLIKKINVVK